jgi:hypothetical protein
LNRAEKIREGEDLDRQQQFGCRHRDETGLDPRAQGAVRACIEPVT